MSLQKTSTVYGLTSAHERGLCKVMIPAQVNHACSVIGMQQVRRSWDTLLWDAVTILRCSSLVLWLQAWHARCLYGYTSPSRWARPIVEWDLLPCFKRGHTWKTQRHSIHISIVFVHINIPSAVPRAFQKHYFYTNNFNSCMGVKWVIFTPQLRWILFTFSLYSAAVLRKSVYSIPRVHLDA